MLKKRMIVPTEFKAEGDKGNFSGYASIFENVDLGGDVIRRGAFKEFVTNSDGMVKVLFSHDSGGMFEMTAAGGLPIGLARVEQNSKGLKFDGQLVMSDPFCQRVHELLKAGTLDGMSIGYDVMAGGASTLESGYRELTALKLWEISPVIWGMNPKASIDTVKSIPQFDTVRQCEAWLRDELDLTHTEAKEFVIRFRKAIVTARDEPPREEALSAEAKNCITFLKSLTENQA
jgi:HK97 family phage prohead protease